MVKRILKTLGGLLVMLLLLLVGFYYWAGGTTYPEEKYSKTIRYGERLANKDTFSVVTYNIGYLSGMTNNLPLERSEGFVQGNLDSAINLFQTLKPDFIGFQEIDVDAKRSNNQNQPERIAQAVGYAIAAVAINWDTRYVPFPYWPPRHHFGKIISAQAVLSQYPIDSHQRILFTKPVNDPFWRKRFYTDRLAQVCQINIGRFDPLILINIHLEAFDKETRLIQANHVLEIYRQYRDFPVLLIGDFNARPPADGVPEDEAESTLSLFLDEGLKDATWKLGTDESSGGLTFSSAQPYKRIDYILHNERIRAVEGRVIKEAGTISDHLPVWMRFTVH